jgi:polysaccharide export outer membrane protein
MAFSKIKVAGAVSELRPIGLVFALAMVLAGPHAVAADLSADYRLGAGDSLHITVFDHEELTSDVRVSESGNITFPLIGELSVSNATTREAEVLLSTELVNGHYLKQAQVSVNVTEFQSQKVGVVGQVQKPGQYTLTQSRRVLDLLGQAGGVQVEAAADDARLIGKDGVTRTIDLRRLFSGDVAANLAVHDGDTIVVPRSPQFYIYGEVQHPGVYRLERGMTIPQAIAAGGGLTDKGTVRSMTIKRSDATGKERNLSLKKALPLQQADVIIVRQRLF